MKLLTLVYEDKRPDGLHEVRITRMAGFSFVAQGWKKVRSEVPIIL